MEQTTTPLPIIEQLKQYLDTRIKLLKYKGIDKASGIIAEIITDLVIVVLALLTFLFLTVTLALLAGHLLGSNWEGFGCITILYIVMLISVKALKIRVQNIFIRVFIRKLFKHQ